MPSVLPDNQGRLWFIGRTHGTVGVLDPSTGKCNAIVLGEEIENSFAVAKDGAYIVSDTAQYKLRAGADLKPRIVWRATYRNDGQQKVGQFNAGSGTTPTLSWGSKPNTRSKVPEYVSITDNADPLDVVVYRAADKLKRGQKRVVCQVPIFKKGASADENSLISVGRSLIAENNAGYDLTKWNDQIGDGTQIGGNLALVSSPGMVRIDINRRRHRLQDGVDEQQGPHAERGLQGRQRQRPRLHVREPLRPQRRRPVVLDRDRLPHRQDRLAPAAPATAACSTTTTPGSRWGRRPAASPPSTWAASAGSWPCATARSGAYRERRWR